MNRRWSYLKALPNLKKLISPAAQSVALGAVSLMSMLLVALPAMTQTEPNVSPTGATPTTSEPTRGTRPTLRLGSQGATVTELQALLQLLGFYQGPVDGIFQDSTANAVIAFQQAAGLTADGIVGANTWGRLLPSVASLEDNTSRGATAAVGGPTAASPQPTAASTPPASEPPASEAVLPTLRLGMRGSAVARLQQRLRAIGVFEGEIDGIFGPATQTAVKAAQRRFNLTPDGIVGNATWTALFR